MKEIFYWSCCSQEEHESESLKKAREELEKHEKECHKGKQVGRFGKKSVS